MVESGWFWGSPIWKNHHMEILSSRIPLHIIFAKLARPTSQQHPTAWSVATWTAGPHSESGCFSKPIRNSFPMFFPTFQRAAKSHLYVLTHVWCTHPPACLDYHQHPRSKWLQEKASPRIPDCFTGCKFHTAAFPGILHESHHLDRIYMAMSPLQIHGTPINAQAFGMLGSIMKNSFIYLLDQKPVLTISINYHQQFIISNWLRIWTLNHYEPLFLNHCCYRNYHQ